MNTRWIAQKTAGHETHGQSAVYAEDGGRDIAIVYDGQAHADLVAAAPEMLEALKEADPSSDFDIDAVRTLAKAALNQPSLQGGQKEAIASLLQQYARFIRVSRAAIAKAEGRET